MSSAFLIPTLVYYSGGSWVALKTSQAGTAVIDNFVIDTKRLIKVVDILGKESKGLKNQPLFYIYDDGTVEKK